MVEVEEAHVQLLAATMRDEDAAEVMASHGFMPEAAVRDSVARSVQSVAVVADGELLCLMGLAHAERPGGSIAIPWCLSTKTVDRKRRAFLVGTHVVVEAMAKQNRVLFQMVDARYEKALRWVKLLGFTVHPAIPFGVAGLPFHPIVRRTEPCAT